MSKEGHRELFRWFYLKYLEGGDSKTTSKTVTAEKAQKIKDVLKGVKKDKVSSSFEVLKSWPGEVTIINGRPRHSQSQGLVEKGNHLVEMQLQAMKCEHKDDGSIPWTDWLPRIQCK